MKTAPPRCAVASVRLEVVDHVSNERELTVVAAIIVSLGIVGVIKSKFGTNRDELVRPPGDTDGMLRILRSKPSPAPNLVVHVLVAHGEERIPRDPKHGVIQHRPLGRVTIVDGKRAALKGHVFGRMAYGVVHVHVPGLGRGINFVVELVRPGSNDLLHDCCIRIRRC